jgi:hypothetical protein
MTNELKIKLENAQKDCAEAHEGMKNAEKNSNWDACDYWYSMQHHVGAKLAAVEAEIAEYKVEVAKQFTKGLF